MAAPYSKYRELLSMKLQEVGIRELIPRCNRPYAVVWSIFFFLNVCTITLLELFGFFDNMRLFPLLYEICVKLALKTVNRRNNSKSPINAKTSKNVFVYDTTDVRNKFVMLLWMF